MENLSRPDSGSEWIPRPEVRSNLQEDGALLMNLRTGKYHALNPVGALIWSRLEAGSPRETILGVLRERYPEARERLRGDLDRWLAALADQDMVMRATADARLGFELADVRDRSAGPAPETSLSAELQGELSAALAARGGSLSRPRKALWFGLAWVALMWTDVLLKGVGFPRFYRIVRGWRVRARPHTDPGELVALCSVIDGAAKYYFKHAWCLQRSAVTVILLRWHGFPVELVIGARRVPFMAHAWAAWGDVVINDDPQVQGFYEELERF